MKFYNNVVDEIIQKVGNIKSQINNCEPIKEESNADLNHSIPTN